MPSQSYQKWLAARIVALNQIRDAYAMLPGAGAGSRRARQQLLQAYVSVLSSQFQAFCRDLHSECVDVFADNFESGDIQAVLRAEFLFGLKLEKGNPNPGNIGADFNRFGLRLMDKLKKASAANERRVNLLEKEINPWRNAFAHQDFSFEEKDKDAAGITLKGRTTINLGEVEKWRTACDGIAKWMDTVMRKHLAKLFGESPW